MEIKNLLERNVSLERAKVDKYNIKKEEKQKRNLQQQEDEKRSLSEKKVSKEIKQMKILDSMNRFEKKMEQHRDSLIQKLNEINNRV